MPSGARGTARSGPCRPSRGSAAGATSCVRIREIADCDIPVAAANDLVDQCVASFGASSAS